MMSLQKAPQRGDRGRPTVLLLYFLRDNYLETTERQLHNSLREHSMLLEARDSQAALQHLSVTPPPQTVLVADASITESTHAALLDALVEYARVGGRVVFGVRFSAHFPYFDVYRFFRRFGMLWDRGKLFDSTFTLNPNGVPKPLSGDRLPSTFATRAQQVTDVGSDAAVYLSTSELSKTPVKTSDGVPISDREFPVAFAPLAGGYVGYVGATEGGPEVTQVLLEMCGVRVNSGEEKQGQVLGSIDNHPGGSTGNSKALEFKSRKTAPLQLPVGLSDFPGDDKWAVPSGGVQEERDLHEPEREQPTVLVLKMRKDFPIRTTHTQLMNGLEQNAVVLMIQDRAALARHLYASPRPQAVLVADGTISGGPEHADILSKLVDYARSGGRVVLGAGFCYSLDYANLEPFYRAWGVSWSLSFPDILEQTYALNPGGIPAPVSSAALFPTFDAVTHPIGTSSPNEVVYGRLGRRDHTGTQVQPSDSVTLDTAAAAWAPVGQGFLGYVGDVDWEQALTRLTIEMCGVKIAPGDLGMRTYVEDLYPIHQPEIPLPAPKRPREAEVVLRSIIRAAKRAEKLRKGEDLKNEGNIKFRAGDYLGAADCYRRAAMEDALRPVYLSNLSAALLKLERWDVANSAASRALYHDPKHGKARFRRAIARKNLKRYSGAKLDLQKFLFLDRTKMNEEGFNEYKILDELEAQGDEVDWPSDYREAGAEEEEDAIEVEERSDSEDCLHYGDSTPCRNYNHDGCSKGTKCPHMHAPTDVYTVRDELGRNVCLYWLLDTCEKGDACAYAHDKTYLPPSGWWTNQARLDRIRAHTERMAALAGRPYPASLLIKDMHPKVWFYESWAIVPYAPTTETRKARERCGGCPPRSYVANEMRFYGIDPEDRDAFDQLERARIRDDNA